MSEIKDEIYEWLAKMNGNLSLANNQDFRKRVEITTWFAEKIGSIIENYVSKEEHEKLLKAGDYWVKKHDEIVKINNHFVSEIQKLKEDITEWEQSFDIYHKALLRGTEKYRAIYPDYPKLSHPDTGKMIESLCDEIEKVKKEYSDYCDQNNENLLRLAGSESIIEKLKEENERLKDIRPSEIERAVHQIYNDKYEKLKTSVMGLLKMQRENCNEAYLCNPKRGLFQAGSEAILNAPEPSIEDLNKE